MHIGFGPSYKKNNSFIQFPVQGLDLKKYLIDSDDSSVYDLYGIVNHYGNCGGGHYTAHCRN